MNHTEISQRQQQTWNLGTSSYCCDEHARTNTRFPKAPRNSTPFIFEHVSTSIPLVGCNMQAGPSSPKAPSDQPTIVPQPGHSYCSTLEVCGATRTQR